MEKIFHIIRMKLILYFNDNHVFPIVEYDVILPLQLPGFFFKPGYLIV